MNKKSTGKKASSAQTAALDTQTTKFSYDTATITEGSVNIKVATDEIVRKKMPVFYNPKMRLNRDISIALLNCFDPLNILDALSASGIRAIRILKETHHTEVTANDVNPNAITLITHNSAENGVELKVTNYDANALLNESSGYDYIDLDVFGSPNPFLDDAIKRISRNGILAVTATDTAPLCGTYPKACRRKYWSEPLRNEIKHEVGLRILIRKVQLIGAQYDKALEPVFCHSNDHYFRIYFVAKKGKTSVDTVLKQHEYLWHCSKCRDFGIGRGRHCDRCARTTNEAGPMWIGKLWDSELASKMKSENEETQKILDRINAESKIEQVGHYDIHALSKALKLDVIRMSKIVGELEKQGYRGTISHMNLHALRSDAPYSTFVQILQDLQRKKQ